LTIIENNCRQRETFICRTLSEACLSICFDLATHKQDKMSSDRTFRLYRSSRFDFNANFWWYIFIKTSPLVLTFFLSLFPERIFAWNSRTICHPIPDSREFFFTCVSCIYRGRVSEVSTRVANNGMAVDVTV